MRVLVRPGLVEQLGPRGLRELASLLEARSIRSPLAPEAVDELVQMVAAGEKPTVGWWRRAPRIQDESEAS